MKINPAAIIVMVVKKQGGIFPSCFICLIEKIFNSLVFSAHRMNSVFIVHHIRIDLVFLSLAVLKELSCNLWEHCVG